MFNKWRFKRYYKNMMDSRKFSPTEWTISLKDVQNLFNRIPETIVDRFTKDELHHLRNYVGDFHYPNVMDALAACRDATVSIRESSYCELEQLEVQRLPLDIWLQPSGLVCVFGQLLRDARTAVNEFAYAVDHAEDSKVDYYKRKTAQVTRDMFSLGEMLSELITRD